MTPINSFRLSENTFERAGDDTREARYAIFISAEGTRTEPSYFRCLEKSRTHDCPFTIQVLGHNRDANSDPQHVFDLLKECEALRKSDDLFGLLAERSPDLLKEEGLIRRYIGDKKSLSSSDQHRVKAIVEKIGINLDYHIYLKRVGCDTDQGNDRFVVMVDRDAGSHTRDTLADIRDVCQKKQFTFCLSNPCFEIWLLLHFDTDLSEQKDALKENRTISHAHSYASNLLSNLANEKGFHQGTRVLLKNFRQFYLPKTPIAMQKAASLAKGDEVLDEIGTQVPDLIRDLLPWIS